MFKENFYLRINFQAFYASFLAHRPFLYVKVTPTLSGSDTIYAYENRPSKILVFWRQGIFLRIAKYLFKDRPGLDNPKTHYVIAIIFYAMYFN